MNFPTTLTEVIYLLIRFAIAGLFIYAIYWFIGLLSLPQTIKTIILAIIALVALLWLLTTLGIRV